MKKRIALLLAFLFYASLLPWRLDAACFTYLDTCSEDLIVKSSPYLDVRAYGAVCDGATDSAAAIQAALDAAGSNSTILIPDVCAVGSAGWDGFTIDGKSNITIAALHHGAGFKVLYAPAVRSGTNRYLFWVTNSDRIHFKNLTFNRNGIDFTCIDQDNTSHSEIDGNYFYGNGVATDGQVAVVQYNSDSSSIGAGNKYTNNIFDLNGYGEPFRLGINKDVYIKDAIISGNRIYNSDWDGIIFFGRNVTVGSNVIDGCVATGIAFSTDIVGTDAIHGTNISIYGNTIYNCGGGIQSDSLGRIARRVSIVGNTIDNTTGSGILGAYLADSIINANIVSNTGSTDSASAIQVGYNASHVTVSNNIVKGAVVGNYGIEILGETATDNITISGNQIYDYPAGISIQPGNTHTVKDIIIKGNNVQTTSSGLIIANAAGVPTDNITNIHVNNNVIAVSSGYAFYNPSVQIRELYGSGNKISGGFGYSSIAAFCVLNGAGYIETTGAEPPTSGTWGVGDRAWNTGADNVVLWKCTTAGTPGTWLPMSVD